MVFEMRWLYSYGRGIRLSPIEMLILFLLKKRPMYGYEIIKELRERLGDLWEPKTGTIYPALRRLEMRGFIETEIRDDREVYKLTELGEDVLDASIDWLEADLMLINRLPVVIPPPYRYMLLKRMFIGRRRFRRMFKCFPFYILDIDTEDVDRGEYVRYLKLLREYLREMMDEVESRIKKFEDRSG